MEKKMQSRRRFLWMGAGAAGAFTMFSGWSFFRSRPKQKSETKKMLTQDGQLVEVELNAFAKTDKKATVKDLQEWVKR